MEVVVVPLLATTSVDCFALLATSTSFFSTVSVELDSLLFS
ncbi:MAG: hypothetical protein ACP5UN_00435 [Candidatus Micrarchaeia archaeon]